MSSALLDEGAGDIDSVDFSAGWKKLRRKCLPAGRDHYSGRLNTLGRER